MSYRQALEKISKVLTPLEVAQWEASVQNAARRFTENSEVPYNGGMWELDCVKSQEGTEYFWFRLTGDQIYTVDCPGLMTTREMNATALSIGLHLMFTSFKCIEAFEANDADRNHFWHEMHWSLRDAMDDILDEEQAAAVITFID